MPRFLDRLLDWIALKAARFAKARASRGEQTMSGFFYGQNSEIPAVWSSDHVEQVKHYTGWVYVAVKAIAEEIAGRPPQVAFVRTREEVEKKGLHRKVLDKRARQKALVNIQPHEELEPVDSSHPLCRLLRDPNGPGVSWDFWYNTAAYAELTGTSYWWAVPNGTPKRQPAELWNLPAHWTWPVGGDGKLVDYYEVRPLGGPFGARALRFPEEEVIAFRYPNPTNPLDGHSPLFAGGVWADTAESLDASRYFSFKNGTRPGMVLELDATLPNPSQPEWDRLYAMLDARLRGETRVERPIGFMPGMTAKPWGLNPHEMDYVAGADQMRDWVLAIYRVSKSIAGITEDVNYASMVASIAAFCQRTIKPKLTYFGQVATEKLARRFDERLVIYWPDTTPHDPAQLNADLALDAANGWITPNEARAVRGRAPYEYGGDDPMVPLGTAPVPWATGETPLDTGALDELFSRRPGQDDKPGGDKPDDKPAE